VSENKSGFISWLKPTLEMSRFSRYDTQFYSVDFGEVEDYLDVNLESPNMMFLVKRYARSSRDDVVLQLAEEKSHSAIHNKILFRENDDFLDRVSFYCYKKITAEDSSSSAKDRILQNMNVKATLTYELFPNLIYNISF